MTDMLDDLLRLMSAPKGMMMNRDSDPRRVCGDKRTYPTRTDARAVKRRMTRQVREVFNIYHCAYCRAWHIGHRLPRSMREG